MEEVTTIEGRVGPGSVVGFSKQDTDLIPPLFSTRMGERYLFVAAPAFATPYLSERYSQTAIVCVHRKGELKWGFDCSIGTANVRRQTTSFALTTNVAKAN